MPLSYPGSDLTIEQLIHALARALDLYLPSKSESVWFESQKIFEIERDLSEISRAIRAIRNTHIPVNRLPPEVLSRVLEYRDCEQDLISATHACQYWRSTLASSSSLWTRLWFQSSRDVDRTLTYLERSKSATIDIKIAADSSEEPEALKYFTQHIPRTKSFIFHGVDAASSLALCNPTPSLEHLEMRVCSGPLRSVHGFLGRQAPLLRSANFDGTFPLLDSPFPLPNLIEFNLRLPRDAGTIRTSFLLQFLSVCPQLQKITIAISCEVLQDVASGQVTLLGSLVEFDYTSGSISRLLPFLKLPRLNRLRVFLSLQEEQVVRLADLLPCGGHALLAEAKSMSYSPDWCVETIDFPGMETNVSVTVKEAGEAYHPRIDWFSEGTCAPLRQIEHLKVEGSSLGPDFSLDLFESLTTLQLTSPHAVLPQIFLPLLLPDPRLGMPCPSLREIQYASFDRHGPYIKELITVIRSRERAGHRLELVRVSAAKELGRDDLEKLRKHVGEFYMILDEGEGFVFDPA